MAYASWEEHVYRPTKWPREHRDAHLTEPPVFAILTSEAVRDHGRIPGRIRTWPGAERSWHPEASVAPVGARAKWLADPHLKEDAYGAESPFARLVEAGGHVLLLGAPLETMTLLHHAEAMTRARGKRHVTARVHVAERGRAVGRQFTDIDTADGAFPYAALGLDDDPLAVMARAALAAGVGVRGRVGQAESHLFPAREPTAFVVSWLVEQFAPARRTNGAG